MVDKDSFREECKAYRKSLSEEEYRVKSQLILNRLLPVLELDNIEFIHSYIPIEEKREVDIMPFVKQLMKKKQKLAVPRADFTTLQMEHVILTDLEQLAEQEMGIREPVKGELCQPQDFDLIIVPMVGADEERNRIGYGKGFYDRFLAETNGQKMGLCYEFCVSDEPITTNPQDVRLDMIVTESRIIK